MRRASYTPSMRRTALMTAPRWDGSAISNEKVLRATLSEVVDTCAPGAPVTANRHLPRRVLSRERFMSVWARRGAHWAMPSTTRAALVVSVDDMTIGYRPPDIDALARHLQIKGVEAANSRQIGRAKSRMRQVEVPQMDSVSTSIPEDLDPHLKSLTPCSAGPQS